MVTINFEEEREENPEKETSEKRSLRENDEEVVEEEEGQGLTGLKIQVDGDGRVHSFTDDNVTWKFMEPITVDNLVDRYKETLSEPVGGLTALKIRVDDEGQVRSFTDDKATWKFINPITVVELVDKYKEILNNVAVEPKVIKKRVFTRKNPAFPAR